MPSGTEFKLEQIVSISKGVKVLELCSKGRNWLETLPHYTITISYCNVSSSEHPISEDLAALYCTVCAQYWVLTFR